MATHVHRHQQHRAAQQTARARFRAPPPALALPALYTTFNRYDVVSYAPLTHGYVPGHALARSPIDGTLWVIYLDPTRRYYYAKYSTDDGVTWSAPELIFDSGTANTRAYPSNGIFIGDDGQPMVQCVWYTGSVNTVWFYLSKRWPNQKPPHAARRDVVARQPQARGGYSTFSGRQGGSLPRMSPGGRRDTAHCGSVSIIPPPLGTGVGYSWSGMGWDGLILGNNLEQQNPVWLCDSINTYWYRGYCSDNGSTNQVVVQRSPIYGRRPWPVQSDYNAFWTTKSGFFSYYQQSSCHWFMDKYKRVHILVGGVTDLTGFTPGVGGFNLHGMLHATVPPNQGGIGSGTLTATARRDICITGRASIGGTKPLVVRGCVDEDGIVHAVGHWQNEGTLAGVVCYNSWWVYGDWEKGDWYPPRPLGGAEVFTNQMLWTRIGMNGKDPIFITAQAGVAPAYPTKTQLLVYQPRRIPCNANHQPDMNANRRVPPRKGGSTIFCGRAGGVLRQSFSTRQDQPQHGGRISVCGPTYSGLDIAWTRTVLTTENKNWQPYGDPVYSRVGQQQAPLTGIQFLAANDVDNKLVLFNFGGLRTYRPLPDNLPGVHTINLEKSPQRRSLEQGRRMGARPIQPKLWHPMGFTGYPWPWKFNWVVNNTPAKISQKFGLVDFMGKKREPGRVGFTGPPALQSGAAYQNIGSINGVDQGVRTSDGRLWFIYYSQDRQRILVKSSADNGKTWSRAELVWDSKQRALNGETKLIVGIDGRQLIAAFYDTIPSTVVARYFQRWREDTRPTNDRYGAVLRVSRPRGRGGYVNWSRQPVGEPQWRELPPPPALWPGAGDGDAYRHETHQTNDGVWHHFRANSSTTAIDHFKSFDGMRTWRLVESLPTGRILRHATASGAYPVVLAKNGLDMHLFVGAFAVSPPDAVNQGSTNLVSLQFRKYTTHRTSMPHRADWQSNVQVPPRKGGYTIFSGRAGALIRSGSCARYDRPYASGSVKITGPLYTSHGSWSTQTDMFLHYVNANGAYGTGDYPYLTPWNPNVVVDEDDYFHIIYRIRHPVIPNNGGAALTHQLWYMTNKYGAGVNSTNARGQTTVARPAPAYGWTVEYLGENQTTFDNNSTTYGWVGLLGDKRTPFVYLHATSLSPRFPTIRQAYYYERDNATYQLKAPVTAKTQIRRTQQVPQRKGGHTTFVGRTGGRLCPLGQRLNDQPAIVGQVTMIGPPLGPHYRDFFTGNSPDGAVTGTRTAWKRGIPVNIPASAQPSFSGPLFTYVPSRPWSAVSRGVPPIMVGPPTLTPTHGYFLAEKDAAWSTPIAHIMRGTGVVQPLKRRGSDLKPPIGYRWTGDGPWLRLSISGAFIQVLAPTIISPRSPSNRQRVHGFVSIGTRVRGRRKPHSIASGNVVGMSIVYKPETQEVFIRAWIENVVSETRVGGLDPVDSYAVITDHDGVELARSLGQADGLGPEYVAFTIPAALAADHRYRVAVVLSTNVVFAEASKDVPVVTVR